ncbi:MAG: glycosyltransferase family 4 protein [Candidatus Omnitrophica bacterium]|nr:glycosyltransferase family 4 protein [Candidatus Omnitrophota bacterium]MBU4487780.1 glycosyltransferase family 4 protein [Candidatus Omnitrophota bacterium]MCG2705292.1 glycosyltransferase family 4 protein [Candidatus Omnitrophota bacterium]
MMKEKKLSIAQFHWGFPPIVGGVESHLDTILPEMKKFGHAVSLLTGSVEGVKGQYKYKGIDIYRTPLMDLNWLYKRGLEALDEELYQKFSSFLKESNPDVIHAHNMHYFSKVHAHTLERLARERGIPLILSAHNTWDDILFLELTHKIEWSHIIAVSHFIKKEILGIGVDDRDITVIHHGVDENEFNPKKNTAKVLSKYPQLKNRKIIFHPARIGLAKGCDVSIKALNFVRENFPDVILVLAGSKNIIDWGETQQKDIAYLVNLIKHFKLEKNILIDAYTLEEMKELYALSNVCIYPSSSLEPFGLTMLESMASAKPIIVTKTGGMPEIIKNGINGFVIPVKDFEALSEKIILLLADKRLTRRLGTTGRQMVESQYTKERVTRDIISVYWKAMGNHYAY